MSDAFLTLLWLNLAAAAGVVLVLALRLPFRRAFGPRVAYGLWAVVPLAASAILLPARTVTVLLATAATVASRAASIGWKPGAAAPVQASLDWTMVAAAVWLTGVLLSLAWLARRQAQFARASRQGRAGPAVVGVLRPRIVTPDDFADRYTPHEQRVVLAHEQAHVARHDTRANALAVLARCLNWFNPALYLLTYYLRIDQELACDAQVVAAHPKARRAYAEAMLKTQLAARPLPLGCYWPAQAVHPLAQRIDLLSRAAPSRELAAIGAAAVGVLALGSQAATWAARPADVMWISAPPATAASGAEAAAPAPAATARPTAPTARPAAFQPPANVAAAQANPPAPNAQAPGVTPNDAARLEPVTLTSPSEPARRIYGVAERSYVEPGLAIRVLATMTDFEGVTLTTDLTSFASQKRFRTGYVERFDSRLKLFTAVVQHGDQLEVTASLTAAFAPRNTGSIVLASGQPGMITLPNGLQVNVTPTVRPETSDEAADGRFDRPRNPRNGLFDRIVDAL